jgi:hypothetical protein
VFLSSTRGFVAHTAQSAIEMRKAENMRKVERDTTKRVVFDPTPSLEPQMSKRRAAAKPAPSSRKSANKRAPRPKVVTRAQRKKEALIRSPKERPERPVAGALGNASTEHREQPRAETPFVDNRARAAALETFLQASLQDDAGRKMRDHAGKALNLYLPFANLQAYQPKLLEMTHANIQFVLEFIQRLVTIKSPFEFWALIGEFTGRRMMMIGKQSREITEFWRSDAMGGLAALPGR